MLQEFLEALSYIKSSQSRWDLTDDSHIVSKETLSNTQWRLRRAPIVLFIFWMMTLTYPLKFKLISKTLPDISERERGLQDLC